MSSFFSFVIDRNVHRRRIDCPRPYHFNISWARKKKIKILWKNFNTINVYLFIIICSKVHCIRYISVDAYIQLISISNGLWGSFNHSYQLKYDCHICPSLHNGTYAIETFFFTVLFDWLFPWLCFVYPLFLQ